MKCFVKIVLLLIVLLVVVKGQDDAFTKLNLVLDGGMVIPQRTEYFSDNWKLGYNYSFGLEFAFTRLFTLNFLRFQSSRFFLDEEKYLQNFYPELTNPEINGRDLYLWRIWSGFKFKFFDRPKRVYPYLWFDFSFIGGMIRDKGIVTESYQTFVDQRISEHNLSFQFGFGLQYNISETFSVNVNANYSGASGINISVIDNLAINLGFNFTLAKNLDIRLPKSWLFI